MNILVINNGYPSTNNPVIYVFVHNQVKALRENGHNVTVLDIDLRSIRWKRKFGFYLDKYEGVNVYRFSFPFITIGLKKAYITLNKKIGIFAIKKIMRRERKFDIVHSHFAFGSGNAGAVIKDYLKIPLIITEHSTQILYSESKEQINYSIEAYDKAAQILVVGNALGNKLASYGIPDAKYLPNIINTKRFYPRDIEKFSEFTFISVGHLISRKGHELTIRAIKALNENGIKCNLIIVGRGPDKKRLDEIIKKNGLNNISLIDMVNNEDLPMLYSQAHCFILPSEIETFGVVYAEAIACGIPAISLASGGPEDIINEKNGIIVAKEDFNALVNSMKQIYQNIKIYKKDELHLSIDKKFGTSSFLESINNIYFDQKE